MQYRGGNEDVDVASPPEQRLHTRITRRSAKDGRGPSKGKQVLTGRIEKASSSRKSASKAAKMTVDISEPFSQSIRPGGHSPVGSVDIEAYVHRSTEERLGELRDSRRSTKGDADRIKRPCNAFMLYRKAYQNVVKSIYKHENHQWISKACGLSWGMETPEVKARFATLARIERDNHGRAFPGYKFSPARSKNSARKKQDDLSDCGSTLDPQEWAESKDSNGGYPRHHVGMPHHGNSSPAQVDFGAVPVNSMPAYPPWGHSQAPPAPPDRFWSTMPDNSFTGDPLMGQAGMSSYELPLDPYDALPSYSTLPPSIGSNMALGQSSYPSIDPKLTAEAGEDGYDAAALAGRRDWTSQFDLAIPGGLDGIDVGVGTAFDAENDSHGSYLRGDGDWNVAPLGDEDAQYDPVWAQPHS
jgi:hypothetical protein